MNSFFLKTLGVSAALLASISLAPSAMATPLYGSVTTNGRAALGTTGTGGSAVDKISFYNVIFSPTTNPFYGQATGNTGAVGTTDFSGYTGQTTYYVACATGSTKCPYGTPAPYYNRNAAAFTITQSQIGHSLNGGTGILFYIINEGNASNLSFYVTQVNTFTLSTCVATCTTGSVTGLGYEKDASGNAQTGTFTLTTGNGTGAQNFTLTFVSNAPEPASLALLGTGLLGMAFFIRRKNHAEQM